jgi:hypothetical protein
MMMVLAISSENILVTSETSESPVASGYLGRCLDLRCSFVPVLSPPALSLSRNARTRKTFR